MDRGIYQVMIFITHELPLLYNVTDDIMVMYAGQIVRKPLQRKLCLIHFIRMRKGLMGSIIVPEAGLRDVKLAAIPGVPPNLKNPPLGCRFAERCKYVQPECKMQSVPLYANLTADARIDVSFQKNS